MHACRSTLEDPTELHNLYGPTEAAVDVTAWRCAPGGPRRVPIGRPVANTQIYVVDDGLEIVPEGVAGELVIGGTNVGRGYLGRPDLTAARFAPDPYGPAGSRVYRTGDRARVRSDGAMEFLGRQDFQVKVRGFRIEPGEVEAVIGGVGGVEGCVVVAQEERLIAYVVAAEWSPKASAERAEWSAKASAERAEWSAKASAERAGALREAVLAAARAQLPEYMVPTVVMVLAALPRLSNGKIDRAALPAPDASRPELRTAFRAPRPGVEAAIAGIWREVIGLDRVGVDDNFFDVGGHSLLAVRVLGKIREAVPSAAELAIVDLFACPTIASLAERVSLHAPVADGIRPAAVPAADADTPARLTAGVERLRQQRLRKQGIESSR